MKRAIAHLLVLCLIANSSASALAAVASNSPTSLRHCVQIDQTPFQEQALAPAVQMTLHPLPGRRAGVFVMKPPALAQAKIFEKAATKGKRWLGRAAALIRRLFRTQPPKQPPVQPEEPKPAIKPQPPAAAPTPVPITLNWRSVLAQLIGKIKRDVDVGGNPRAAARQLAEIILDKTYGGVAVPEWLSNEARELKPGSLGEIFTPAIRRVEIPSFPALSADRPGVLILIRDGETAWSEKNEDRWAGQRDIELTETGRAEIWRAGDRMPKGVRIDRGYASDLSRARNSLDILLAAMRTGRVSKRYERALRERDYGDLVGWNRKDAERVFGADVVARWRRGYAGNDARPPGGENLQDVQERLLPFFIQYILQDLADGRNVVVSAHGNSLRAILIYLREHDTGRRLSEEEIRKIEVPLAIPILIKFTANFAEHEELPVAPETHPERIKEFLALAPPSDKTSIHAALYDALAKFRFNTPKGYLAARKLLDEILDDFERTSRHPVVRVRLPIEWAKANELPESIAVPYTGKMLVGELRKVLADEHPSFAAGSLVFFANGKPLDLHDPVDPKHTYWIAPASTRKAIASMGLLVVGAAAATVLGSAIPMMAAVSANLPSPYSLWGNLSPWHGAAAATAALLIFLIAPQNGGRGARAAPILVQVRIPHKWAMEHKLPDTIEIPYAPEMRDEDLHNALVGMFPHLATVSFSFLAHRETLDHSSFINPEYPHWLFPTPTRGLLADKEEHSQQGGRPLLPLAKNRVLAADLRSLESLLRYMFSDSNAKVPEIFRATLTELRGTDPELALAERLESLEYLIVASDANEISAAINKKIEDIADPELYHAVQNIFFFAILGSRQGGGPAEPEGSKTLTARIGQLIRNLRVRYGHTQEELAQELAVTISTLNRWENGHARPSRMAAEALSRVLPGFKEEYEKLTGRALAGGPVLDRSRQAPSLEKPTTTPSDSPAPKTTPYRSGPSEPDQGDLKTLTMTVGQLVHKWRKHYGFTQEGLAHELGVTFSSVSRWENGHVEPSKLALLALCNVLPGFKEDYEELTGQTLTTRTVLDEPSQVALQEEFATLPAKTMLGQLISEWRRRYGFTQEEFAHALGVTVSTVGRWENGHAEPSKLAVKAIIQIMPKFEDAYKELVEPARSGPREGRALTVIFPIAVTAAAALLGLSGTAHAAVSAVPAGSSHLDILLVGSLFGMAYLTVSGASELLAGWRSWLSRKISEVNRGHRKLLQIPLATAA